MASTAETAPPAEAAVAELASLSADVRGCAILDRDRNLLAASGERSEWLEAARTFADAADAAGGEPVSQAHVATADGEAFLVRERGLLAVTVTDRFALASLVLFDMRSTLRDLQAAGSRS